MDAINIFFAPRNGQYTIQINAWRGAQIEGTHNLFPIEFDREETTHGQAYPFYVQRATLTARYGEYLTLQVGKSTCVIACDKLQTMPAIVEGNLVPTLYLNGIPLEEILREIALSA